MTQRQFRFIPCENYPFPYVNIYVTENKAAVRLLSEIELGEELKKREFKSKTSLLTDEKLAATRMDICTSEEIMQKNMIQICDKYYYIAAEYIFDKNDPRWDRSQVPSSNLIFTISRNVDRELRCHEKALLTYASKWRANHYTVNEGFVVPFQMYVRSTDDSVLDVCKSIAGRPNGIITNLKMKDAIIQTPKYINEHKTASNVLIEKYIIEAPESVKPNETFECRVVAVDGMTSVLCEEINYDAFEIEAVDGYLPHKRVSMKGGIAKFRATALGLEDGETMRIKFGRKFLTGLAECTIQIKS